MVDDPLDQRRVGSGTHTEVDVGVDGIVRRPVWTFTQFEPTAVASSRISLDNDVRGPLGLWLTPMKHLIVTARLVSVEWESGLGRSKEGVGQIDSTTRRSGARRRRHDSLARRFTPTSAVGATALIAVVIADRNSSADLATVTPSSSWLITSS